MAALTLMHTLNYMQAMETFNYMQVNDHKGHKFKIFRKLQTLRINREKLMNVLRELIYEIFLKYFYGK